MLAQSFWALLVLLSFPLIRSQTTQLSLSFDTPVTLIGNNFSTSASNPVLFSLPSSSQITISLALCASASSNPPRVFVSSSGSVILGPSNADGQNLSQVTLNGLGLGNFTLQFPAAGGGGGGGILAVYGGTQSDSLEIGVSQGETPLHAPLADLPFFGDSTADQAILFSPAFLPPEPAPEPTFPNYTLPQANTALPVPPSPSSSPNLTLFFAPLDTGLTSLPQTACAIRARGVPTESGNNSQSPRVLAEQPWLRDAEGWRREWLVGPLQPLTNYSVYVIQDGTRLSRPLFFTTKSTNFSCPLVHALPYCPTTAYSVPLPQPHDGALLYDASNLPDNLTSPLLSYLTNFTTSLLTNACGRDSYSPLRTCADCQAAYRHWLCAVSLPRCAEFPQAAPTTAVPQQDGQATLGAPQIPPPALAPQPSGMPWRNAALGNASEDYAVLLPCIETCNAADRACPVSLGFRCPRAETTGPQSYGVGFIDSANGDVMGGGATHSAQDQWGNVFCNGS
ncbi:stretch-activated cation channel Mid1 [Russula earlei]|uniref:Stretch-activated cation channel Mid1 n=1 Tax=Russula earlei TaxID=71964 RepID=A0ACC0TSC2_9AGAM|nr:stretch-activated cation channel Mid1 [Russula earlei]